MDFPPWDEAWNAQAAVIFASLCGGILRLLFRPADSLLKTLWLLFGCVTCGFYATPPLVDYFDIMQNYSGAVGAAIGFIGLSIAEGILRAVDAFDFKKLLYRVLGISQPEA